MRIPVVDQNHKPLMPTTPSRVRKWLKSGKAIKRWSDCGQFYVQLVEEPSGIKTQDVVIGIDPGKLYSGIGVQSSKETLYTAHLNLPFSTVRKRMEQRAMLRRSRRCRRINRKISFHLRAHRQKRYSNRRKSKLPPSIRANRQLELRIVKELCLIYPIIEITYEYLKSKGGKGFGPVMTGQKWMLKQLETFAAVKTIFGHQTALLRDHLKLNKNKVNKSVAEFNTHAVDGVAIACSHFIEYKKFYKDGVSGGDWFGNVQVTKASFFVIGRPLYSRRQLHAIVPAKGGNRRRYGGTITCHNLRKGDLILTTIKGIGYVSGCNQRQISVSNFKWKRLGRVILSKVKLLRTNNGLTIG
jgi:hypothetical protein